MNVNVREDSRGSVANNQKKGEQGKNNVLVKY